MNDISNEIFQIEIPTVDIITNKQLVNYLNDKSFRSEQRNQGFTMWHFKGFRSVMSAATKIHDISGEQLIPYRLFCENQNALFISYGDVFNSI